MAGKTAAARAAAERDRVASEILELLEEGQRRLAAIGDPATREHAARLTIEAHRRLMGEAATVRAFAVQAMHEGGLSWRKVGAALTPPVTGTQATRLANPETA
jgi:hypothetical protein